MLTEKKLRAIKMMIQGISQKEVANQLGVHFNTISNWKKDRDFQEQYEKYEEQLFQFL